MRKHLPKLFIVTTLWTGLLVMPEVPAHATSIDCGAATFHRFDGGLTSAGSNVLEGAFANITSRFGYLCDTVQGAGAQFTTVWPMVVSNEQRYAQSGLMRYWGQSANHLFAEDGDAIAGTFRRVFSSTIVNFGNVSNYQVKWVEGTTITETCNGTAHTDYEVEYAAGTILQTTNYAPLCRWSQPWNAQFFGEVVYPSSDVNGIGTAKTTFANMATQSFTDNQFHAALPGFAQLADNPTTEQALGDLCSSEHIACDTYNHTLSNYTLETWTSNPH